MKKLELHKEFVVEDKKRDHFGEALSEWFGRPCYSTYKKFGRVRTERVFNEMVKLKDKEWEHFMQRLHHD
jgi:hypothetical protein